MALTIIPEMMVLAARGLARTEEEELLLSFPQSACPRPNRGRESRPRILHARTLRQAQGRHLVWCCVKIIIPLPLAGGVRGGCVVNQKCSDKLTHPPPPLPQAGGEKKMQPLPRVPLRFTLGCGYFVAPPLNGFPVPTGRHVSSR